MTGVGRPPRHLPQARVRRRLLRGSECDYPTCQNCARLTDRGYRKPVKRAPHSARNRSDVTPREYRASAFCAQVRCDGRGWVTVGISATRGEAARTAAQAYVTPICNMTPRQVRVMRLA